MGRFRYTIKDLEHSDTWLLLRVIQDRKNSCTNIYSPLYKRLSELQNKISNKKQLTDKLAIGTWSDNEM